MQINLNHVQRDTSNRWLLSDVLDAIQHQMPGAWNASARVAGGLSQWLDEQELETLLSAHSNELETKKKQVEYEQLTKNKQAAQVLYAYDKANPNTKWAVGTTTLDFERLTLSSQQFKDWVSKLLKNDTVSFLQREDLHAASYYLALAKAQTIIITNERNGI